MLLTTQYKLPRKDALKALLKLKEGGSLTETEIDGLILYFAPGLPKKAKTQWQWIAQVVKSPLDKFRGLHLVRVLGGKMYGCDGYQMRWAETDIPEGYYEPKTALRLESPDFAPLDLTKSIPDRKGAESCTVDNLEAGLEDTYGGNVVPWLRPPGIENAIKKNQLLEALSGTEDATLLYHQEEDRAVSFFGDSKFGSYLIMPYVL